MWLIGGKKDKKSPQKGGKPTNLPPGVDPSLFEDQDLDDEDDAAGHVMQAEKMANESKGFLVDVNVDGVTLTEDDENDPELIQALIDSGHEPTPKELEILRKASAKTGSASAPSSAPAPTPAPAPAPKSVSQKPVEPVMSVQEKIDTLKKQAIEFNRAGNKAAAIDLMRQIKALEAQDAPQTQAPASNPKQLAPSQPPAKKDASSVQNTAPKTAPQQSPPIPKKDDESVLLARKYIEDLKKKGTEALKANDKEAAKACIAKKKVIEAAVEQHIQLGASIDLAILEDNIEIKPVAQTTKTETSSFDSVLAQLKKQSDFCKKNQDRAAAASDLALANFFDKESQMQLRLIDKVSSIRAHGGALPKISYLDREFEIPDIHHDVGELELALTIIKCMNVSSRGTSYPDTYISFEFTSPVAEAPQTGTTSFGPRELNPAYNSVHKLRIARNPRFVAALKTKKMLKFRIHEKKMLGISSQVFGEGEVKIDELAAKSEMQAIIDLNEPDRPRKQTGMKLVVSIKARYPLEARQQNTRISEHWLVLGDDSSANPAPKSAPTQALSSPPAKQPLSQPKTSSESGPRSSAAQASAKSAVVDYSQTFDQDKEDIDAIPSFKCLEWEVEYLKENLPKVKGTAAKTFRERIIHAQEKMKMIEEDIQMEITTPESYMEDLKTFVATSKAHMKEILQKEGKQDKRLPRMMKRTKVVEEEIRECQAAADAAEEEE